MSRWVSVLVSCMLVSTALAEPSPKDDGKSAKAPNSVLLRLFGQYGCKGFSQNCLWNDLEYSVADVPWKLPDGMSRVEYAGNAVTRLGANDAKSLARSLKDLTYPNAVRLAEKLEPIAEAVCPSLHSDPVLRTSEIFPCFRDALYEEDDRLLLTVRGDASAEQFAFIYSKRPSGRRLGAVASSVLIEGVDEDHIRDTFKKIYPEATIDSTGKVFTFGVAPGSQEVGVVVIAATKDGYNKSVVLIFKAAISLSDQRAHDDEMRLLFQERWLKNEMARLRVDKLDELVEYTEKVAEKSIEKKPDDVGRQVAPLYLYASQLSEKQLTALDDLRVRAATRIRAIQAEADKKAKAEAAAIAAREKQIADQRAKGAAVREEEWKRRQELLEAERKRQSDPKLVSRLALCRASSDLDLLYDARAHEAAVEAVSGVADLTTKRLIGERIVAARESIEQWTPKFKKANGHEFERLQDCAPTTP